MARAKKSETGAMVTAGERFNGLKTVDSDFDLGNGLTAVFYKTKIDAIRGVLDKYNSLLTQADEQSNIFDVLEKELRDLNERFLLAVAVKYGKDSNEYEMAGGTRKSERARRTKNKNGNQT